MRMIEYIEAGDNGRFNNEKRYPGSQVIKDELPLADQFAQAAHSENIFAKG